MPWVQQDIGGEGGGFYWFNTDTGQTSFTDPNIALQMAGNAIGNIRAGGTGFGTSNPMGWSSAGSGEGQPNGYYWTAPNGQQFYIPPSMGVGGLSATNIFGTDKLRPDDALGVMIQAGYDEATIRSMIRSNPTAFSNVGIIEKDLPYWLEQARRQAEIGQRQNQEADTLGNLVRSAILGLGGATIAGGLLGAGPFAGSGVAVEAGGAMDMAGSLNTLTGASGETILGTQALTNASGGLASELVGADAIETMINAANATNAGSWTQAAQQLGFNSVENLLSSINPAWVQTGLQYALNNPVQSLRDLANTGSLNGMQTAADGSQISNAVQAGTTAANTATGAAGTAAAGTAAAGTGVADTLARVAAGAGGAGGAGVLGGIGGLLNNLNGGALGGAALGALIGSGAGESKQIGTATTTTSGFNPTLSPLAEAEMAKTIRGDYLNPASNPWLTGTFDRAAGELQSRLSPSFGHMQAFGDNSGWQNAYARGLADLGQNIYGGNYNNERQRQFAAAGSAPNYTTSQNTPIYANKLGGIMSGAMAGGILGGKLFG